MGDESVRALIERLTRDAERLAVRFQLQYRAIEAERSNVRRRYGICFSDGTIRIRLQHNVTRRPLKYSSLVSTLCHELAHLRHFNHGPRFRALNLKILEFARSEGIYRPRLMGTAEPRAQRPAAPQRGPEQLGLFG
ncbi:MAG: M48 family metallopeptidase [Myxococcota bacterium]